MSATLKNSASPLEWKVSQTLIPYPQAVEEMERRVDGIIEGSASELVWFIEHPPLFTAGTSADQADMQAESPFPLYQSGRGGQITYHGPGQRVVYVMLDLKKRDAMDIRAYVKNLESWIIATLARFGVTGETREGRIGVWVTDRSGKEAKIAALGIRVRKWVAYHGISLNVDPDLTHYNAIVPCGIREYGVTSLKALGIDASMAEVDAVLKEEFSQVFAE